jgi:hypothetical protein
VTGALYRQPSVPKDAISLRIWPDALGSQDGRCALAPAQAGQPTATLKAGHIESSSRRPGRRTSDEPRYVPADPTDPDSEIPAASRSLSPIAGLILLFQDTGAGGSARPRFGDELAQKSVRRPIADDGA